MKLEVNKAKTRKLLEARENASDQVAIVSSFASNWLRGWREFSEPITKQNSVHPKQTWITIETQLKLP